MGDYHGLYIKNRRKIKKLFTFEVIYFLFDTEETRTVIFPIFYMLIEYFMFVFMIRI